jgi:hypothetical protein
MRARVRAERPISVQVATAFQGILRFRCTIRNGAAGAQRGPCAGATALSSPSLPLPVDQLHLDLLVLGGWTGRTLICEPLALAGDESPSPSRAAQRGPCAGATALSSPSLPLPVDQLRGLLRRPSSGVPLRHLNRNILSLDFEKVQSDPSFRCMLLFVINDEGPAGKSRKATPLSTRSLPPSASS